MKKIKNTLKKSKSKVDFNLDQILNQNNIDYADLDFNTTQSDVLKSYKSLNSKINEKHSLFKNIKSIFPEINFTPILKPIYTIILTSIIIFSVIYYQELSEPVQYTTITVEKGEKINLHISDNLSIYLNSGSTVKIPTKLKSNSEIILDGEAYFELKENKDIKVLANGVLFQGNNSNFYINSTKQNHLSAQVFKGSVEFYNPALPKSTILNLKTNDKVTYVSGNEFISVENDDNKNAIAWHTGELNFKEEHLQSVVNEISDYFDIPIEIQNKELNAKLYTANFKNLEIDTILDNIQFTFNCNISTDGSKIIIN